MVSPSDLEEFKRLYRRHYGLELDDDTALSVANDLIELVKIALPKRELTDNKVYNIRVHTVDVKRTSVLNSDL